MRLLFIVTAIVLLQQSADCFDRHKLLLSKSEALNVFDVNGITSAIDDTRKRTILNRSMMSEPVRAINPLWKIFDFENYSSHEMFPDFPLVFKNRWGVPFGHQTTLCNLEDDQKMKVIFPLAVYNQNGIKIYVFNGDGKLANGWPVEIQGYEASGVACGDVDGDGLKEVVIVSEIRHEQSFLYVFNGSGQPLDHFPVELKGYSLGPSLADLDLNGKMEIAIASSYPERVTVFKGNGAILEGWPQPLKGLASSTVSMGDLNGDGYPEIVAEDYSHIFIWDRQGNILSGFPFLLPGTLRCSYSSPVLADINFDGFKEILFGTHDLGGDIGGAVFVLDRKGTVMPGWPRKTDFWIYGPPSVGFLNRDSIPDIAVGDVVLSVKPVNQVYAWNAHGIPLKGFPYGPVNAVDSQIALLNLENKASLIFNDNQQNSEGYGFYHAISYKGKPVPGWPIRTKGTTYDRPATLVDFDSDGFLDMIGASISIFGTDTHYLYIWKLGVSLEEAHVQVATSQYNSLRNGDVKLNFPRN